MTKQVPFIDREDELALVDKLIREWATQRVLCVDAPGGIGKTRLLQEVHQRYASADREQTPLIVTGIINFDDYTFHISQNLRRQIAQMLDGKTFEPFLRALLDWRRMEMAGVSPERLAQEVSMINRTFVDLFNGISAQQRVVLFMDATDALEEGKGVWNNVVGMVSRLRNCVVLIAGRNARRMGESLQVERVEGIQIINLLPLTEQASESYLQQKRDLWHITLEPELVEKLLFLAEGRPILIDLAVECRARGIRLDWLVASSLEEMKSLPRNQLERQQQEFEQHLVRHIADTRKPIDWLILMMSRVYPMNMEMAAKLLSLSKDEAKALFEDAQSYVFVKSLPDGRTSLHDEMRRMVNKYVWPQVDPDGDRRRRGSRLAAECLGHEIHTLTNRINQLEGKENTAREQANAQAELNAFIAREALERELWVLSAHRLTHILLVDLDEGVETFADLFDEATRTYRFHFREALFIPMRKLANRLSHEQRYELDSRLVKHWLDEGKHQQAQQLATEILAREDLLPAQQVDMLIQRGNSEIRLGRLEGALRDFDRAAQISQEYNLQGWLGRALNARGWAYRIQGSYDLALESYLDAYQLSLSLNDLERTAWILNNMAYVNAIKGNRSAAFQSCQDALEIWEEIESPRGKGATYSTLGEISRWLDQLADATTYFAKALDIFTSENDTEWISVVRAGRASLFRTLRELDKAQEDLKYALENGPLHIRPRIFYEQAKILWLKNDLESARQQFEACREVSQEVGDIWYDYMSFTDLLELAWEFGEYHTWRETWDELEKLYGNRKDEESVRLRGSCLRKIGDLAICSGEYQAALDAYKEGLPLIAKYATHRRHTIREQIEQIYERIHRHITQDTLNRLGRDLTQFWSTDKELAITYPTVLSVFNRWALEGPMNE